ncbi:hypothetical protein D0T49_10630 [Paludibacter sp. 221]|nr:hypothetical protein [Paludibacter sp. 221]
MEKYGNAEQFLTTFNPDKQVQYARHELQCFASEVAPSLTRLSTTYGNNTAEAWLEIQLKDLSEFSGCKEKLTVKQFEDTARTIILHYGHLKVTELMVFFQQFKAGQYGKFYGAVDGLAITSALKEFMKYRSVKLFEIESARQRK